MSQLRLWFTKEATAIAAVPSSITTMELAPTRREGVLADWLSRACGYVVSVRLTRNRSTMISSRRRNGGLEVRVHEMFVAAPEPVLHALAAHVAGKRGGESSVLSAFIEANLEARPRPPVELRPRGRFHDLSELLEELNATYFHSACTARITWGNASGRAYRRTIQLGCYVREDQLIRMHPSLDQAFVPRFYIKWIVFHELLHEVMGVERAGRRRKVHPPEFAAIEESYPDYARCKEWERDNLPRLLRFRPQARR